MADEKTAPASKLVTVRAESNVLGMTAGETATVAFTELVDNHINEGYLTRLDSDDVDVDEVPPLDEVMPRPQDEETIPVWTAYAGTLGLDVPSTLKKPAIITLVDEELDRRNRLQTEP